MFVQRTKRLIYHKGLHKRDDYPKVYSPEVKPLEGCEAGSFETTDSHSSPSMWFKKRPSGWAEPVERCFWFQNISL